MEGCGSAASACPRGNGPEALFPTRELNSQQLFILAFPVGRKASVSKFRQQGTITELVLYFPIWSPAQAGTWSIIIYDAAPAAAGRGPESHVRSESPSLYQFCAHRWL